MNGVVDVNMEKYDVELEKKGIKRIFIIDTFVENVSVVFRKRGRFGGVFGELVEIIGCLFGYLFFDYLFFGFRRLRVFFRARFRVFGWSFVSFGVVRG